MSLGYNLLVHQFHNCSCVPNTSNNEVVNYLALLIFYCLIYHDTQIDVHRGQNWDYRSQSNIIFSHPSQSSRMLEKTIFIGFRKPLPRGKAYLRVGLDMSYPHLDLNAHRYSIGTSWLEFHAWSVNHDTALATEFGAHRTQPHYYRCREASEWDVNTSCSHWLHSILELYESTNHSSLVFNPALHECTILIPI